MSGTMVVIKSDGTETVYPWLKKKELPDHETVNNLIGDTFEIVKCRWAGRVRDMYVEENAKWIGRPANKKATALIRLYYGPETQVILGTVMVWVPESKK